KPCRSPMSDFQSIRPGIYLRSDFLPTKRPIKHGRTVACMRTKERTAFGERLREARLRAKLTQADLARKVGLGQSAIAEAENTANGTTKTVQIAKVLGVRPEWLADGTGEMLDAGAEPPAAARTVASEQVAHYLVGTPASNDYRTIAGVPTR